MDNKNKNISTLDIPQIQRQAYDENLEANRVVLVGSDLSGFKQELKDSISEALKDIKLPELQTSIVKQPLTDEKPFVLTTKEVEKPIIITNIEYKEIEKPIIIEKIIYKEVEKPVIVTNIEYKEIEKIIPLKEIEKIEVPVIIEKITPIPGWIKYVCFGQILITLLFLLRDLLK